MDLTPPEPNICESCLYGRQCQKPFEHSETQRTLLELVHSDLLGPVRVLSIIGSRYVLTFIDQYSHFPRSYYLKTKESSAVLEKFKEYKSWAENITNQRIKILRTDNGGEYVSKAFELFLSESGITHQRTVPYTPQQNGVSERFNRTAMERVRSIIHGTNLPLHLWAEIFDTIRYLYTLGPAQTNRSTTPEALFYQFKNRKTSVTHLCILGYTTYVHIPDELRTKLEPKSKKTYLVGYGINQKGYRVWDPDKNVVYISRDVIFDEMHIGLDKNIE